MKLLILTNKVPIPANDGGAIATIELAKSLSPHFDAIDILAINTKKHFHKKIEQESSPLKNIAFHTVKHDTSLKPLNLLMNYIFSKTPYIAQRFYFKSFIKKLKYLLRDNKYDVIQIEGLYMCQYIKTIREDSKALVSYRAHNVENEIWKGNYENSSGLKRLYLKKLFKQLLKFEKNNLNTYDVLVPISSTDAQWHKENGNIRPYLTIPPGNFIKDPQVSLNRKKNICYIGALDWMPNQHSLLWFCQNVWSKLRQQNPDLEFHVAGRNAPNHLKKSLLGFSVHFHGEVESSRDFISKYKLMVVPLFSGSGIRVKIIESMALGTPVITTTKAAQGLDVKNGEHLLIADSPDDFINKTNIFLNDNDLSESLKANGLQFIQENFDTFTLAKRLTEFYKSNIV